MERNRVGRTTKALEMPDFYHICRRMPNVALEQATFMSNAKPSISNSLNFHSDCRIGAFVVGRGTNDGEYIVGPQKRTPWPAMRRPPPSGWGRHVALESGSGTTSARGQERLLYPFP
jgi:hypothetical protein